MAPSLGLKAGHAKRDVSQRRNSKRHPATKKGSLLLEVGEAEMMGRERVELDNVPRRRSTMPSKVSQPHCLSFLVFELAIVVCPCS